MQTSYLMIESLQKLSFAFQEDFHIKAPNESPGTLECMARSFSERVLSLFKINDEGRRPFHGPFFPYAKDPHWRDHLQFYEYFHAELGKGLGASHQSGWTVLIANVIDELKNSSYMK